MKYIKLTGFGNHKTHYIPTKAIVCIISHDVNYTEIKLNSGNSVNVIENDEEVINILEMAGMALYDESYTDSLDDEASARLAQLYDE
jgi:hypothetical protein